MTSDSAGTIHPAQRSVALLVAGCFFMEMLDGTVIDIRIGQRIEEVGGNLVARLGENVLDAGGGTVLPGLHDHHVHLRSAASALASVSVGPPMVNTKEQLAQALSNAMPGSDGWIRAVGYHESVAGELDRAALDTALPGIPLRVQHRSGALWVLNSAGLARVGMGDHLDGRLRSDDRGWSDALRRREADLAELSRRLTAVGVTGVTDATPDLAGDDMENHLASLEKEEEVEKLLAELKGRKGAV